MEFFKKHRESLLYLLFGGLTTLVNLVVFLLCGALIGETLYLLSNLIAWVAAVVFAFVVNKIIVFRARSCEKATLAREIVEFVGARVFSFGLEELGLFLLVDVLPLGKFSVVLLGFTVTGQLIAKLILAVVVVILNYFFSKFIIFKKAKEQ
ncbi:MAG: GtrA family protein [Clostridia bacterium]|nr:GtrA family protein [Clostridia bacterium]